MNRHRYRSWVLALTLPLLGIGLGSGCSRQSEGEPCDSKGVDRNGASDDCESGLICTDSQNLQLQKTKQDRCCPPIGNPISDDRCTPRGGGAGTGGAGGSGEDDAGDGASGTAGESGTGGTAGEDSGTDGGAEACATPCDFTSECAESFVCGPRGCCQPECRETRDCTAPEQCVAGKCELVVPDSGTD